MRIYSIDVLKFIFAMLVVFSHMDIDYPGAGVAVDFFFVFSGFFLAKKFYSKSAENPQHYNQFKYTADHIKKLYPQYIFSLLVLIGYITVRDIVRLFSSSGANSFGDIIFHIYEIIPDSLMLQDMGGFIGGGINAAAWYVSAMLIVGYFIYWLLCKNQKTATEFILPLVFLAAAAFMKDGRDNFAVYSCFYVPLVRCALYMAEGVILYRISRSDIFDKIKNSRLIFNLIGLFSLAAIFGFQRYKNIHFIIFAFIVLYTTCPESLINKIIKGKCLSRIGDLSYAVYLNHSVVIMAMHDIFDAIGINMPNVKFAWIAAAVSIVYSVLTMLLLDWLKPLCKNKIFPFLKSKKII